MFEVGDTVLVKGNRRLKGTIVRVRKSAYCARRPLPVGVINVANDGYIFGVQWKDDIVGRGVMREYGSSDLVSIEEIYYKEDFQEKIKERLKEL